MYLNFTLGKFSIKANISENKGRFAAQVQCPLCPKNYQCDDARNPTSAKYRVRDTLKCHMRRRHRV